MLRSHGNHREPMDTDLPVPRAVQAEGRRQERVVPRRTGARGDRRRSHAVMSRPLRPAGESKRSKASGAP